MPRRYGVHYEPFSWASKREQFAMTLLMPLAWTLAAIPGGLAGLLVYAVTNNSTIGWAVGIAVAIGYVLWLACSVYAEQEK